jgi:diguanylate cyclase (GGDEF)-like protein
MPLRNITDAVVRAGREPGAERVEEGGTAEVTTLARMFNRMLDIREGHEAQLAYQAEHDALTGLPNRVLLRRQLDELRGDARPPAVLWVGIDRLDVVNDSFGHDAGDRVVSDVAARLSAALDPGGVLACLGRDQFAVVCEDADDSEVEGIARRLHHCFEQPFSGPDGPIVLRASIGIANAQAVSSSPDRVLREADSAMREARATGRGVCRFEGALQTRATQHLEIEHALGRALRQGEFLVHYQPLLDLASGRIVGAEALVRWQHPDRGLVPPLDFIPIAEQTGQIAGIGDVVLDAACRQAASWRAAGHPLRVSVNVAAGQLEDSGFPAQVARVLSETGLPADQLCLEITESSLIGESDGGFAGINALRSLGISLAIDDFGTGYSSLSYLHQMPVDELKIDRSFISRLDKDDRDRHLVAAIISMAHALDLAVVAEGVETHEQHDFLVGLDCRSAQGYLFAKPQPAEELLDLVRRQRPTPMRSVAA